MDEFDAQTVSVRADTAAFARDVAAMRSQLADGLGAGADKAAQTITAALTRATGAGKTGFADLGTTALKVFDEIAAATLKGGLQSIVGGGSSSGGGGLLSAASALLTGLPGRATGGPVSPGQAYLVGERGPELFVPTASGAVAAPAAASPRDVRVAITVNAQAGEAPAALQRSSRQIARAVRTALARD